MKYILLFFLFLQGCAASNRPLAPTILVPTVDNSPEFYTVTIKDPTQTRFTGLLGISANNHGLHYILLDATGITLLEARIDTRGNVQSKRVFGPLQKSRLPGFLAGALKRIFLEQPTPLPCEKQLLSTFCEERFTPESGRKWRQTGPFTWWSVEFSDTALNNHRQSLVYAQFLSGITLYLTKDSLKTMTSP